MKQILQKFLIKRFKYDSVEIIHQTNIESYCRVTFLANGEENELQNRRTVDINIWDLFDFIYSENLI